MKGRTTSVIAARVPDYLYQKAKKRAAKKKRTLSEWVRMILEKELS